ncbi:MAG: hypothetical protein R6V58_06955, partial [Planctomycetota bacterium]
MIAAGDIANASSVGGIDLPPCAILLNPEEKDIIIKNCQNIKYKSFNVESIDMDALESKEQAKEKI